MLRAYESSTEVREKSEKRHTVVGEMALSRTIRRASTPGDGVPSAFQWTKVSYQAWEISANQYSR